MLDVTASSPQAAPGYIFASPYSGRGRAGPEIFNQTGELVWFDPLAGETEATNLQVQQLDGKPVLTWWQGYIPPQGFGEGEEIIDNSSYQQVGRVHAGNGYKADLHDFHITPQDTALLTVFNPIDCNLSAVGGPSGGAVTDSVFQEIDLADGARAARVAQPRPRRPERLLQLARCSQPPRGRSTTSTSTRSISSPAKRR